MKLVIERRTDSAKGEEQNGSSLLPLDRRPSIERKCF
jgi:hypothetical protein